MSEIVSIFTGAPVPAQTQPAALPAWQQAAVERMLARLQPAMRALAAGAGDASVVRIIRDTGVSAATARRTLKKLKLARESGDYSVLAPRHRGRVRKPQPWHAEAQRLGELPSRPNNGTIAFELRRQGFAVTTAQVRRYRQALPSHRAETSPRALGANHYKLTHTPYVIRDWAGVPVGYQYEADGHSCDFYIEHPKTGAPFKPELTFWLDLRSQFVVGFWISGFENAFDIRMSLSRAILAWDHVPHEIHADCGAYKARVLADEASGYCIKLGIAPHFAIARNARSKPVEGEWRLFTDRCARIRFADTYVHDRTDDGFRQFRAKWNAGQVTRVSLRQCYDIIGEYVAQRNQEFRPNLLAADGSQGATPAEVWATLARNPVEVPAQAIARPRASRSVRNRRVRIDRRVYEARELMAFETRKVLVEYDDWQDKQVWIFDLQGRFFCTAELVRKRAAIPASRVAERLARQREVRLRRLEIRRAEVEGQSARTLSPAHLIDQLDTHTPRVAPPDPASHILTRGTSLEDALPAPVPAPRASDPASIARLRAAVAAEQRAPAEATPEERFARAYRLLRRQEAGAALAAEDARWLGVYRTSSEFHSRWGLAEEFGFPDFEPADGGQENAGGAPASCADDDSVCDSTQVHPDHNGAS